MEIDPVILGGIGRRGAGGHSAYTAWTTQLYVTAWCGGKGRKPNPGSWARPWDLGQVTRVGVSVSHLNNGVVTAPASARTKRVQSTEHRLCLPEVCWGAVGPTSCSWAEGRESGVEERLLCSG